MKPWNVIVAALGVPASAAEVVQRRIERSWTGTRPLAFRPTTADGISDDELERLDAAVLVVDGDGAGRRVLPLLSALEETGAAVIALLEEAPEVGNAFAFAGAFIEAVDIDDEVLTAQLHGMLHRQSEITRLRREVAIAQRFQGGLEGEIARIHEELQLAAMVQREFLPRELPTLCGVEFGALWRPAHYVSGDIYDVTRLDDDHIGFFIADAVGHGVPAALMTMVICRSLRTKEISGQSYRLLEPSEVLARLNTDMIRRQGRTTRFCTAVYGIIDCRTRTMRIAGAGHPPPLLYRGDDAPHSIEMTGGLLGVFEDETYEQLEMPLEINDRLLLYSDGFEQAFPVDEADDYERRLPTTRYLEEFEQLATEDTPHEMIQAITRRLDDQQGSLHQLDDLTLVCLHAGPLIDEVRSDTDTVSDHAPARN